MASIVNYSVEGMSDEQIKQRIAKLMREYNRCIDGHTRELKFTEADYLRAVLKDRSFKTPKKVVRIKNVPTRAQKNEYARMDHGWFL